MIFTIVSVRCQRFFYSPTTFYSQVYRSTSHLIENFTCLLMSAPPPVPVLIPRSVLTAIFCCYFETLTIAIMKMVLNLKTHLCLSLLSFFTG